MSKCAHLNFRADVAVNRLENIGRFTADVKICCADCGHKFRFIGLPRGLDLNGCSTSVDATEARLAIAPVGDDVPPITGLMGFDIKGPEVK